MWSHKKIYMCTQNDVVMIYAYSPFGYHKCHNHKTMSRMTPLSQLFLPRLHNTHFIFWHKECPEWTLMIRTRGVGCMVQWHFAWNWLKWVNSHGRQTHHTWIDDFFVGWPPVCGNVYDCLCFLLESSCNYVNENATAAVRRKQHPAKKHSLWHFSENTVDSCLTRVDNISQSFENDDTKNLATLWMWPRAASTAILGRGVVKKHHLPSNAQTGTEAWI